ncbi:MAG: NosD domain-containing protein, partial [Candidatus Hodarchaeota archaeon]
RLGKGLILLILFSVMSILPLNQDTKHSNKDTPLKKIIEVEELFNSRESNNLVGILPQNTLHSFSRYEEHDPISINGDDDFIAQATAEGWSGNGSHTHPYEISELAFTGPSDSILIYIRDTSVYFLIKNCLVSHGGSGISFTNVRNGQVINNTVNNNRWNGISLSDSSFNTLAGNKVTNNSGTGILLALSRKNIILDNVLVNNVFSVLGMQIEDYIQQLVLNNSINGKALIYWQNRIGEPIPDNVTQLILVNSDSIDITGLELISVVGVNCSHLQIQHNIISAGKTGVYFFEVTQIQQDAISAGGTGVYFFEVTNTLFSGNTVSNYLYGIEIQNCVNCSLVNNDLNNNGLGISIRNSNVTNLSGNTIYNNYWSGIRIQSSDNCTLVKNNANNNDEGISIYGSSFNTLAGNQVTNNSRTGIHLALSRKNIILDNVLVNNSFSIRGMQIEDYLQQLVLNNSINGKALIYWQNRIGEPIPDNVTQLILVNSDSIDITRLELISVVGVNCSNLQIQHNIISAGKTGIDLYETPYSLISGNTVEYQKEIGINLVDSPYCVLAENIVVNNSYSGIDMSYSGKSKLTANSILNNGGPGIYLFNSGYSELTENTIINNDGFGICLSNSSSSSLIWNVVSETNGIGIALDGEGNNTIYGNTLTGNTGYGIQIFSSYNNLVHWNNFINNRPEGSQASDSGNNNIFTHNYWSDWSSSFFDSDGDGIVDIPYPISGEANNQDSSPLISPYTRPLPSSTDLSRLFFSVSFFLFLISLTIFFIVRQRTRK